MVKYRMSAVLALPSLRPDNNIPREQRGLLARLAQHRTPYNKAAQERVVTTEAPSCEAKPAEVTVYTPTAPVQKDSRANLSEHARNTLEPIHAQYVNNELVLSDYKFGTLRSSQDGKFRLHRPVGLYDDVPIDIYYTTIHNDAEYTAALRYMLNPKYFKVLRLVLDKIPSIKQLIYLLESLDIQREVIPKDAGKES